MWGGGQGPGRITVRNGFSGRSSGNKKYDNIRYRIVKEMSGDLFTSPKEWSLAHCVATDMRMGSGIAVNFR